MILRLEVQLNRVTKNLFDFVENVHRLCREKKDFTFAFNQGKKLYLDTCKGMQNNWYVCIKGQPDISFVVATLNYSLALGALIHLSLEGKVIFFDLSSNDEDTTVTYDEDVLVKKIASFADGLGLKYYLI